MDKTFSQLLFDTFESQHHHFQFLLCFLMLFRPDLSLLLRLLLLLTMWIQNNRSLKKDTFKYFCELSQTQLSWEESPEKSKTELSWCAQKKKR